MFWIIIGSTAASILGILSLIYFLKKGHFEELEDVKYQMFHDDE